jgi:hypothetical protein
MFYFVKPETGHHIFLYNQPRKEECDTREVNLVLGKEEWHKWLEVCLGVSLADENQYQIFRTPEECRKAGFRSLGPNYGIFGDWAQYKKLTTH